MPKMMWAGCDQDCENCPYPDCYMPASDPRMTATHPLSRAEIWETKAQKTEKEGAEKMKSKNTYKTPEEADAEAERRKEKARQYSRDYAARQRAKKEAADNKETQTAPVESVKPAEASIPIATPATAAPQVETAPRKTEAPEMPLVQLYRKGQPDTPFAIVGLRPDGDIAFWAAVKKVSPAEDLRGNEL